MRGRILIAAALCLVGASRADAGPFVNGSFEVASLNPGAGFATVAEGSTQITGWEVFDLVPAALTIDYIGTFWQAADGARSVDLTGNNGAAGIRQTFDTLVGTTYRVEFAMAGNPDGPPDMKQVLVEAGGVSQSFLFDAAPTSRADMGWIYYALDFTADSTATTLSFLSQTSGVFFGPAIDDVSVQAVPEPASMTLLATGAVGLLVARLRRRR